MSATWSGDRRTMIDPRQPNFASTPASPDRARYGYAPRPAGADVGDDLSRPLRPPAVAVVTPFYNTGEVFHQTAACVLGQSLQNFEWIIVNDCSTDPAARAVLDEYRPGGARNPHRDPRVRIIDHRVNHGLSAARDTGYRTARAPYVFQLDSDDLIEPTTLEKCALFLEANPEFCFVKGNTVGFEGQEYLWEQGFHDRERFLEQNLVTATAMLRREVHARVGGFDDTIRGGMEDWEFWLRAADLGLWGATIPEFLDWYRRRPPEVFDAWANLKCEQRNAAFKDRMRRQHARLFESAAESWPRPERPWHMPWQPLWEGPRPPFANTLAKPEGTRRLLLIVPWLRMGGADRFNLDLTRFLTREGWEVTIAATLASGVSPATGNGHPWLAEFSRSTPDIFILPHLGSPPQFPALLKHLVDTRRHDVVLISNSEHGYAALPYLRTLCPQPVYLDFNHMEEPGWKGGGHPRHGAGMQSLLELNLTVSEHLKRWMASPPRNAAPDRIEVCHINVNTRRWRPDESRRATVRRAHRIAEDAVVILYAARLCPQKQPHIFAESVRMLRDRLQEMPAPCPPVVVLVAGDGELEEQLRDALDAGGLLGASPAFSVRMLGAVRTDRMPAIMSAADVFFLPSEWEGIALSIYEAMASGLAVLGADVGGQRELVTPETGLLLPRPAPENGPQEAARYAEALATLVGDPARRESMGRAARRRIEERFELRNMGERMLQLFDRAAALRNSRPRKPLEPQLARELTAAAIESLRAQELADVLWQYRARYYQLTGGAPPEPLTPAQAHEHEAAHAMAHLESSRSWRLVQSLKRLPPYAIYARARWGPNRDLDAPNADETAAARLERVQASRAYRALIRIKRLPPVRVVTRMRHGRDYQSRIPPALREQAGGR